MKTSNSMDRISELPEHIVHNILSRLSTKQASQTSVLSKRWLSAWHSFPILVFDQAYFLKDLLQNDMQTIAEGENLLVKETLDRFMDFVDASIERFVEQNLRMKKFEVVMSLDANSTCLVDKWLRLAVENMIEDLNVSFDDDLVRYTLPGFVLGAASLKSLSLCGCKLDLSSSVKFRWLRKLSLQSVKLDDQSLQSLTTSCQYLEHFIIKDSTGLKNLEISGLDYLKIVEMDLEKNIFENVHIEARNLEKLWCFHLNISSRFEIEASSSLQDLYFEELDITDKCLHNLFANSPGIEKLHLKFCDKLRILKILSHCLSRVEITYCSNLVEAQINAPSLKYFLYYGKPVSSFTNIAPLCFVVIFLVDFTLNEWTNFLSSSFEFKKLLLQVNLPQKNFFKGLRVISPPAPWKLEHLTLGVWSRGSNYAGVLDSLLWSCKPKTLGVIRISKAERRFVEYLYQRPIKAAKGCSRTYPLKCWRNSLKKFEVTGYFGPQLILDGLSDLFLQSDKFEVGEFEYIQFGLQWDSHICHDATSSGKLGRFVSYLKKQSCFKM